MTKSFKYGGRLLAAFLLLLPAALMAQTPARFDLPVLPTTPKTVPVGSLPTVQAVTNATVAVCGFPAVMSGGMCTNKITTYTDGTLATACPASSQLTPQGSNQCVPTTGLQGGLGFWYNAATQTHMTYTVQTSWGTFGPYDILQSGVVAGGATFPSGAITYGITPTNSRAVITTDVASLLQNASNCSLNTGMVYSPLLNGCIAAGTAANPAGSNQQVQFNASGLFGIDPLFSYNSTNHQLSVTGGLTGYQPPGTNTTVMNRDTKLNADISPQNYNAAGEGTWETGTNDIDGLYQAELLATSGTPNQAQTKVHGKGLIYLVNHANALINLPTEYGDYQNNLSGSGAFASITIDLGKVTACSGSGGSGYDANGWLPIQIIDTSHQGSGATAYVPTNSSGVPVWSSCTVMTQGMNYPATGGLVTATALQTGADGATANCGNLVSGGAFASTTCTVTAGGSGFASAPSCGLAFGPSFLQGSAPNVTCTVSGGAVTGVTLNTVGSGLTWNGSASGGPVTVCIGACKNGVQATNLVPLTPNQIGCGLPLRAGVDLDLEGGAIYIDDVMTTTDLTRLIPICDPWGDQGQNITIENGTIFGMVGAWFAGPLKDVQFKNVIFPPRLIPNNAFLSQGATGSSLAVYAPQMLQNVTFDHVEFNGNGGILCGGIRSSRTAGSGGMGSLGGTDISEKTAASVGGACDGLSVSNSSVYSWAIANTSYTSLTLPPLTPLDNSYSSTLDTFIEQYLWQSQYSNLSNPEWSYNATTCPSAVTPQTQRDTDFHFGNTAGFLTTNPYYNCYRGVSDMMIVANSRYGYLSRGSFTNLFRDSGARPLIVGSFNYANFKGIVGRYVSTRSITGGDPYLPASTKWNGIIDLSANAITTNTFANIFNPDTGAAAYTQTLGIAQNTAQNWTGSSWSSVTPVGTQLGSNTPASQITVSTNYLNNPANIPGSTVSAAQALFGIDAGGGNELDLVAQAISAGATAPIVEFWVNTASGYTLASTVTQKGAFVGMTKGIGTNTWVVGTAFGTTPPTASLPTGGTSCESNECTVTLTAATGASTGTMITFTITTGRHDTASCMSEVQDTTAHTKFTAYSTTTSGNATATVTFTASAAPTVGDVYFITVHCGGY